MTPSVSLICSTYNNPLFLELVLDSIKHQSFKDFELIIADDGSTSETSELIKKYQVNFPVPIVHVWHEDNGWRKCQIHNKAILKAQGKLLAFIDGDCVLAPGFLQDHYDVFNREQRKYVLMGRRVELGPELTKSLDLKNYRSKLINGFAFSLLKSCLRDDSRGYSRILSLKYALLRKLFKANNVHDLLGSNFSLPKASMIEVNGFNEDYQRGEDGELFVRLRNTKHKLLGMKYYAVNFHLWHSRGDYTYVDEHYETVLLPDTTRVWATNGLVKGN